MIFVGCSAPIAEPVVVASASKRVDYLNEVKPILEKRCVVCHSCYNSPCQLKLSSYEGLDRGATKALVYDGARLSATDPTRLFMDAKNTQQWHKKGFYSVTHSSAKAGKNNSLMIHLLDHKMHEAESIGEFRPDSETLTCPKDGQELADFLDENPNKGMPYGFPALKTEEYNTIAQWLAQGAQAPTLGQQAIKHKPSPELQTSIEAWETFLNNDSVKHQMSARYLYEHLFLAHLYFSQKPDEFFEIVRSETPPGLPIKLIPTLRPYDDPGVSRVYYRLRKIYSTIVHKTHMTVALNEQVMARYKELFIDVEWVETPHMMAYDNTTASNAFVTFAQIPPRSRYQFLLDNSEYIIRTFIRGPVCKGQIALNVINDHFWVMFLDPDADKTILDNGFLSSQYENLRIPNEKGSSSSLFRVIANRYTDRLKQFHATKQELYKDTPASYNELWVGDRPEDAPILTVYRHFDSASVHRGALGDLPRTAWVIDYTLFERIYYALVAGFDVYGNVAHQLEVRLYMDGLRVEGEDNFLRFMPQKERLSMMSSWYGGTENLPSKYHPYKGKSGVVFETSLPKQEFIEHFIEQKLPKNRNINFDMNYFRAGETRPGLPTHYKTIKDYIQAVRSVSLPGTNFIKKANGFGSNLAHLRIQIDGKKDAFFTIVINRWHDNVTYLIGEENKLNPNKDSADFIPGLIGSYPNFYFDVKAEDLPDFFDLIANYEETPTYFEKFFRYGIPRNDPRFWETYDIFQKAMYEQNPIEAGLFDLNRYYYKAWSKEELKALAP